MAKPVSVERGLELSMAASLGGVALFLIGIVDALGWWTALGAWGFWSGAIGLIMAIVGIIWLVSIYNRMRQFKVLIAEKSRAAFLKNLDELEYTAWRLPSRYDRLVAERKSEMGVK